MAALRFLQVMTISATIISHIATSQPKAKKRSSNLKKKRVQQKLKASWMKNKISSARRRDLSILVRTGAKKIR